MEIQKINSYKLVKKIKIPNKARKHSSLVFDSFFEGEKQKNVENWKRAAHHRELIKGSDFNKEQRQEQKKSRRQRRKDALGRIKLRFSPEEAAQFTKKSRSKMRSQFGEVEWDVFCWYTKSCRRGVNKQKRSIRGRQKRERRTTYENFINSPGWREIKNRYWQNHPRSCAICYTGKYIHLHHMVYGKFGDEKDEDLIPLCKTHHDEYHAQNGTQRNMKRATMAFIEAKRTFIPTPSKDKNVI